MKKLILLFTIVVVAIVYGAWDNDKPADSDAWNNAAGYIRNNNDALEVELGIDLNEAHPYFQASAPTKKPDGSTVLDVDDNGRLWVDSDDNVVYILTDYSGPTWTAQTAASSIAAADPTFTLQNTDEENTAGGRQSRFIAKGEQDGTEVTTLGFTEFSHDGSSDDEKGKWRVVLNSGSEGNSPTNVPIEYTADGKIKVSTSLSVLDEDDLTSDGDKVLATQQSIKAYVDAQDLADHPAYTGGESHVDGSGLIIKGGYVNATGDQTITFGYAFPTACISLVITDVDTTSASGGVNSYLKTAMGAGAKAAVNAWVNTDGTGFTWMAMGY